MNLSEEKPSWGATKAFCSLGPGFKIKSMKKIINLNWDRKLHQNLKQINKTLTSRVTREKQWDTQSSTYNFSSRNKMKVM